jgi:hypothetical protein
MKTKSEDEYSITGVGGSTFDPSIRGFLMIAPAIGAISSGSVIVNQTIVEILG